MQSTQMPERRQYVVMRGAPQLNTLQCVARAGRALVSGTLFTSSLA